MFVTEKTDDMDVDVVKMSLVKLGTEPSYRSTKFVIVPIKAPFLIFQPHYLFE